jgi:hypothetical protein
MNVFDEMGNYWAEIASLVFLSTFAYLAFSCASSKLFFGI